MSINGSQGPDRWTRLLGRANGYLIDQFLRDGTNQQRLLAFFSKWHSSQSGNYLQARCLVVKLSAE